jgi:hypothetical protein
MHGRILGMDINFGVAALVQHKSDHAILWIQQFIQVNTLRTGDVDVF